MQLLRTGQAGTRSNEDKLWDPTPQSRYDLRVIISSTWLREEMAFSPMSNGLLGESNYGPGRRYGRDLLAVSKRSSARHVRARTVSVHLLTASCHGSTLEPFPGGYQCSLDLCSPSTVFFTLGRLRSVFSMSILTHDETERSHAANLVCILLDTPLNRRVVI